MGDRISNAQVRRFWLREYERYSPGRRAEAISPIQNEVGACLAHPRLQRILGHEGKSCDLRTLIESGGVLVVNVAKGLVLPVLVLRVHPAPLAPVAPVAPVAPRKGFYLV